MGVSQTFISLNPRIEGLLRHNKTTNNLQVKQHLFNF